MNELKIIEKAYKWKSNLVHRCSTKYIVLHHASASKCTADDIHSWHIANGWAGIGYHFFIRKDGKIYRGRPENTIGAHAYGRNNDSIGICFEGNYEKETMPDVQKKAGIELVEYLRGKYSNVLIAKHKDFGNTDCPGKNFPFDEIANSKKKTEKKVSDCEVKLPLLKNGSNSGHVKTLQILLNKKQNAKLTEDGIFGTGTEKAVKTYQKNRGITVDGVVGEKTWTEILK